MSQITFPLQPKKRGNAVVHLQDRILFLLEKKRSIFIPPSPLTYVSKPPDWPKIIKFLKAERNKKYYGRTTVGLISNFQKANRLKVSGSVDKHTAEALNRILDELELNEPETAHSESSVSTQIDSSDDTTFNKTGNIPNKPLSYTFAGAFKKSGLFKVRRSFTVVGTVKLANGKIKKRQKLLAFDLDLRGVAVYRSVKSIAEIEKNGGFEPLGEALSDNLGNYKIIFYDRQYRRAERGKADVVVYAVEGKAIIGNTRMVNTEDYSDKGLVRDLDLVITKTDERTEYAALMSALNKFLKESESSLDKIAMSPDQLVFTAGELDIEQSRINIVVSAALLKKDENELFSHELLYGIGRQNIRLTWSALYQKQEKELREAVTKSENEGIIQKIPAKELSSFLQLMRDYSVRKMLDGQENDNKNTLNVMLSHALPNEKQRLSFVNALSSFKGSDFSEFWGKHLPEQAEFKNKPELISGLLFTQQLTLLTGNNQTLVNELQVNNQLTSAYQLLDFEKDAWLKIIQKTGVPDFIEGKDDAEKTDRYASLMQGMLNAAFPTQRIQKMLQRGELSIGGNEVSKNVRDFLATNKNFDFSDSRIHDFNEEIKASTGDNFTAVNLELMKIQRIFQVSASPEAMTVLMDNNLDSAYKIANIPRKSFIKTYSKAMGSEDVAFAVHQRATHISTKAEMTAMHLMEYSHTSVPDYVMGKSERELAMTVLQEQVPNYSELFGSPDVCECKQCRSIYSAAAYFVDMLRFLSRGVTNDDNETPLKMLASRRPDLLHLPLTCENTNTVIPYIDLVNEVMEYYAATDSLTDFEGYNTGETTAEELRANPQNFILKAYEKLKDAKYPFTLPYHQPLDAIRTYSDQIGVSLYEVLKAVNPQPDATTTRAIEAESLKISQEVYRIYTGKAFDSRPSDATQLQEYFGYPATVPEKLEELSKVREFLQRSGIDYADLVELVKTMFINPYQGMLGFLERIFSYVSIDAGILYTWLGQIEAGTLDPDDRDQIVGALTAYGSANDASFTFVDFEKWVTDNFNQFQQVITLFAPNSRCSLDNTRLRTIQHIYEKSSSSGISNPTWSKIHRFIRLWRTLGWTIQETDLMLTALGEDDITPETISKLESVVLLKTKTKLPINQLAALWGNIDVYGDKSLYKKLFLNKEVQQIDQAFKVDVRGNYLQNSTKILEDHKSTILAAFRITEEDFAAILEVAEVAESGAPHRLDLTTAILKLQNLSILYRHTVLAKALKIKVVDLCKLISLLGISPFSRWDINQEEFINILPNNTLEFYRLAVSTKSAGFKPSALEYIFQGTLPADSTIGLGTDKVSQTAKTISDVFAAIEQKHPAIPEVLVTPDTVAAKLSFTFESEIVSRFMAIVEGTASFEASAEIGPDIIIPDEDSQEKIDELVAAGTFGTRSEATTFLKEFSRKYSYVKTSGRVVCIGVMSDIEQMVLKGLTNVNASFENAVDELYGAPEVFIRDNFNSVFGNLAEANATLLDHPAHPISASLDEKLIYVYEKIIPLLKSKLRQDVIIQNIAVLIGISEGATALLIAGDIDVLITNLSAATLDDFVALTTVFHRAAEFVSGFNISEVELNYFIAFNADFDNINFKALNIVHWQRIHNYAVLRNAVPQAQASLTDVFALAGSTPIPTVDQLIDMLHLSTAWDKTNLYFLIKNHFSLNVDDFKNEIALNRLYEIMQIVTKTGISSKTIAIWGSAETDFKKLNKTSQLIKNTLKAKYETEDWLDLAGDLSNKIRDRQRQALVDYLLVNPDIQAAGVKDADGLFEYLLIDVQMGACMDTSRVVQANAAVQMFINRCLLNLESKVVDGSETGVSPASIDRDRWQWMKNYRVWEANRKVFLYPENWLEPEWRNDRSEFFKELESYLVQNDITDRSVEQGLRNYLTSLNEVANLEVCGTHLENYDDRKLKYLHVFARTHNAPYKFFYRRWNEYKKWSAWEKVQLDIRSVEGIDGGVHLVPVVWKKRFFLFWPEFIEISEASADIANKSVEDASTVSMSILEARRHWEIRLAWSEYVDEKWSPKQLSREFVRQNIFNKQNGYELSERDFIFTVSLSKELVIKIAYDSVIEQDLTLGNKVIGGFRLSDIQSPVTTNVGLTPAASFSRSNYTYAFSKRDSIEALKLELLDDIYLQNETHHKLLPVDTLIGLNITLDTPFFFSDVYRTYFVRPVDIPKINRIKNPGLYKVYIPKIIYNSRLGLPDFKGNQPIVEPPSVLPIAYNAVATDKVQPAMETVTLSGLTLNKYGREIARTNEALGAAKYKGSWDLTIFFPVTYRGLEFHTFYHPFSSKYVSRLNQGGLAALMGSDTENSLDDDAIKSDNGATFEKIYNPKFTHGLVKSYSDFDMPPDPRTAYKENVCFDVYGANSLYNWELFFHAPLYIATRLSKNGKYEEAMKWFHYIFNPTTDDEPEAGKETTRYWKVLPLKTTPTDNLESLFLSLSSNVSTDNPFNDAISEWRKNPFDPHLVASNRPVAYMKQVVIKYVENLVAWGDSLFRQFSRESVNEALQLYVIANHILGPRPEFVPKRGRIDAESYSSLEKKWDDFSNSLVELENIFPYSSEVTISETSTGTSMLGIGSALYFCIPTNDKLLELWDTVADRLFKIRHCQDLDGVERKLALFSPPIDPAALIQAASQGLSLSSILADLSSPPSIYRFTYLIQKANEFCMDVKALGSTLLAALEKKDGEELSRLRASQEKNMLELVTAIKERQVLDSRANKESLLKSRETAEVRLQHYTDLLGNESVSVPTEPSIETRLTSDSQLPGDTNIQIIETDVDVGLVDSSESGVKLITREQQEINFSQSASNDLLSNLAAETLAGFMGLIPQFTADGKPLGVGAGTGFGGRQLGWYAGAVAKMFATASQVNSLAASKAAKMSGYIRREQDWTLQANLASREIIQLDKQITSADIRIQITEKELENHQQQIDNTKEVELFLKNKFTNQELYQWMKEQLFSVYKQSYNLAFDMAKKAEKAYKYEMGTETASFIQYGYWDNSKQGLVSGEKLQLALRRLEQSYLEENRRELELTKSISLVMLNPLALIELRETGKCYLSLPEELFDLDFQGHYFRRIKSVSLSIPCISGPYTTVNCSLRLLSNSTRINTAMSSSGNYEHNNDDGLLIDDARFRSSNVPVTSIATSTAQNDAGMFEFNFKDERYLPFEGAGAISDWQIELSTEKELRQFDYSTISDMILHLKFTARESGGLFKKNTVAYIKDFIMNTAELADQPLMRMFRMKHEFPTEWHKFLYPTPEDDEQLLSFTVGKERFPFFAQDRDIVVMKIEVFAKCTQDGKYKMVLSYTNSDGDTFTSPEITMPQNDSYGGLNKAPINVNDAGLNLDQKMSLKVKLSTARDYKSLATEPDEVEDIFLVVHYKLS